MTLSSLPTKALTFGKGDPITAVPAAALISLPIHCTEGSSLFLDTINPLNPVQHSYIKLSPSNHTYYSPALISGLTNIQVWDTFPTTSEVVFLLKGSEPASADSTSGDSATFRKSSAAQMSPHFYIASFTAAGAFKRLTKLPIDYQLYYIAALENGDFVVTGYDSVNNVPRLLLVSDTGEIIKAISLPKSIQNYNAKNDRSEKYVAMAAAKSIGSVQFTAFGREILAWLPNKRDPIISIDSTGYARQVSITYPAGYMLSDVVSSTTDWILHLEPQDVAGDSSGTSHAHNMDSFVYVEVDPTSGDLLSTVHIDGGSPRTFACEDHGDFTALHANLNNTQMWLIHAQ